MTGYTREELIGHTPLELRFCLDYNGHSTADDKALRHVEAQVSTKSGELRNTLVSLERIIIGGEAHLLLMVLDISERLNLEAQLRQAQKMEAIGQLAAGVAHDFNNLLTIIQGHASLQLTLPGHDEDSIDSLQQIALASERAADLTRQLLAFSRPPGHAPSRAVAQYPHPRSHHHVAPPHRRASGTLLRHGGVSAADLGRPDRPRAGDHESHAQCARCHAQGRPHHDHDFGRQCDHRRHGKESRGAGRRLHLAHRLGHRHRHG